MTFAPIATAETIIQFHIICGTLSLLVGPLAIYRKRRDRLHKISGYTWVLGMGGLAVSSFFIHGFAMIGPFSPLHGFALLALWGLFDGMRHIFAGRVHQHEAAFKSVYWNGLLIASLFNFLPGRTINRTLFGEQTQLGLYVIALGGSFLLARMAWTLWRNRAPKTQPAAG